MRIRTGIIEMTAVFRRNGFIKYTCSHCGAEEGLVYTMTNTQTAYYHELGGEDAKQSAKVKAAFQAMEELNKAESEMAESVNIRRDYEKVTQAVICSRCGEKQVWSGIPCEWKAVKFFRLWIVGLVFSAIAGVAMLISQGVPAMIPWLLILVGLPFVRKSKRKKALKQIQNSRFEPPVYYTESDMAEWKEKLSEQEKTVYCADCGQKFQEEFGVCPRCGKSI